jgi:hypothetical protein
MIDCSICESEISSEEDVVFDDGQVYHASCLEEQKRDL